MLNAAAMERLKNGKCEFAGEITKHLATAARESNAAIAEMILKYWSADDEIGDAEFVPEIIIRVRRGDNIPE